MSFRPEDDDWTSYDRLTRVLKHAEWLYYNIPGHTTDKRASQMERLRGRLATHRTLWWEEQRHRARLVKRRS